MCEWIPISSRPSSVSALLTASAACPCGQRDTELLVLVGGGDELVRMGLDAHGDPDLHPLAGPEALGGVRDLDDLLEGVEDDTADTGRDGALDLLEGLVVAVEGDALGGHSGGERGGEFTAGAHVEIEPLLVQPADHGPGQERLARVEHVRVTAEGVGPGAAAGAEVGLVEDVRRGAELLGQPGHLDARDGGDAVLVPADRTRPDLLVENVQIGGRGGVVPFGEYIRVAGACGVCGTAHLVALLALSEVFVCGVRVCAVFVRAVRGIRCVRRGRAVRGRAVRRRAPGRWSEVFWRIDAEQGQAMRPARPRRLRRARSWSGGRPRVSRRRAAADDSSPGSAGTLPR